MSGGSVALRQLLHPGSQLLEPGRENETINSVHVQLTQTPPETAGWLHLSVVNIHRVPSARYSEDGSIVKELGELVRVKGSAGDEEFHV